jgi:poly[(R)-3-hydroxyalkanoate] polymerase subunit PhaC
MIISRLGIPCSSSTLQNDGELTFVLTSGGHNAGIVSEPGHPHRHFRIRVRDAGGHTLGPDEWEHDTPSQGKRLSARTL